jgi:uncharacterized protein YcbX
MSDTQARISALYVYPVKSCRGIQVDRARVARRGFERDRRWMVVDDQGQFLTQRTLPALCRVATSLHPDGIELAIEGRAPYLLPLEFDSGPHVPVSVWGHQGQAIRHADGSRWLTDAIGYGCSLVFMPEKHERAVNPERGRPGDIVSFADGYPFLLISEASLAELNSRLAVPLEMQRFRPNIVITGTSAFAEDEWSRLLLGEIGFRGVKRCDRCVVTTLNPLTGEGGKEPLTTLAKYRRSEGKVWFGMNLIHDSEGWLAVGDQATQL